jgi:hypothetical protein
LRNDLEGVELLRGIGTARRPRWSGRGRGRPLGTVGERQPPSGSHC